jgi:hypothetical protein
VRLLLWDCIVLWDYIGSGISYFAGLLRFCGCAECSVQGDLRHAAHHAGAGTEE